MITLQFILYNLTFLLVIAHFLDSAKEKEWTDFLYKGSYTGWLISSLLLILIQYYGYPFRPMRLTCWSHFIQLLKCMDIIRATKTAGQAMIERK